MIGKLVLTEALLPVVMVPHLGSLSTWSMRTFDQSASKGFVHVHGLSSKIAARRDLRAGQPQQ